MSKAVYVAITFLFVSTIALKAFLLLVAILDMPSKSLGTVLGVVGFVSAFAPYPQQRHASTRLQLSSLSSSEEEVDVVVVGSGIGGLSCAAVSSKYGLKTLCLEAHDVAGGCAHSFKRYSSASSTVPFCFDSGPSLITGLSSMSTNPLRQVLDAVDAADEIDWKTYDGWVVHDYADGKSIKLTAGDGGEFEKAIEAKEGVGSRRAFESFRDEILRPGGLAEVSAYIPPFALRGGGGLSAVASIFRYIIKLMSIGTQGIMLTGPFSNVMDKYNLQDPFVRKWFDYLAFALSGVDASNTQGAPVAYMMSDLHKSGAVLDYPMGGMDSLVQALITGMQRYGGELRLGNRVEKFLLEDNAESGQAECVGVVLADGTKIRARKGVVSNAPLWNYARILQDSVNEEEIDSPIYKAWEEVQKQADGMNMTRSFMHLHLGIPKDGLPDLECHHSVLNFDFPVTDEQNMVIISIPTVFDPSLAPEGYHVVHAYTAASDAFDDWEELQEETGKVGENPNSGASQKYNRDAAYQKLKQDKAEALWKAVECVIPDVRERAKRQGSVVLVGTPLTHRRYNQRFRGTYGPGINDGKDVWELAGATTPINNLYACGDTSFPGIGLPGVAASGTIAANSMVEVGKQLALMDELRKKGSLQ